MLKTDLRRWLLLIEPLFYCLVTLLLLFYGYGLFVYLPYEGFVWGPNGQVLDLEVPALSSDSIQEGDQLLQVGPVAWADFESNPRLRLFENVEPGQVVLIVVRRSGLSEPITVQWVMPARTAPFVVERLGNQWFLAYLFLATGLVTLLVARPKDTRWHLLVAFNFLTALWLGSGIVGHWHLWESRFVLRSTVWLAVPVYLHLHWVLPKPLRPLPTVWVWIGYGGAGILAVSEWLQWLPSSAYLIGLFVALSGSAGLLVMNYLLQPAIRRDVRLIAVATTLSILPTLGFGVARLLGSNSAVGLEGGGLIALVFIPGAYLYAAYRKQLGGLEIRANRLISLAIFLALLVSFLIPLTAWMESSFDFIGETVTISTVAVTLAVAASIFGFPAFQQWIERNLLGIQTSPAALLETHAARITGSLALPHLVALLHQEVAPSLFIRQSALVRFDDAGFKLLYAENVSPPIHPSDIPPLLDNSGYYRPPLDNEDHPQAWVRLALPLKIDGQPIALWLLGRRDPDDFYSQHDIRVLQSLANQTAIALVNISQADRLHALHQTSIDQREAERSSLGRDLHDDILQQLSILPGTAPEYLEAPLFSRAHQAVLNSLRQVIRGLRPPMLEYGLYRSVMALADDWSHRPGSSNGPAVSVRVPETDIRYARHVELHLYRILQQAGENALRHARARHLQLTGSLEAERVVLKVEDDGIGFEVANHLDLSRPETRSNFGLIGMQERAALIKARLKFTSAHGAGTCVELTWENTE